MSACTLQVTPGMGYTEFLLCQILRIVSLVRLAILSLYAIGRASLFARSAAFREPGQKHCQRSRTRCPISEIYDLNVIQFPKQLNG